MFRIHAVFHVPTAPRDNHPAVGIPAADAERVCCVDRSPNPDSLPGPFICTRAKGHSSAHQAAIRPDGTLATFARPLTPDAIAVIAEWDDARDTDGHA